MLRTVVFKEALSTRSLPRVPLHSWSSLVPSYNRAWQFTAILPWVGENFVVTRSEHTLFILDPENGLIVGVLTLGHQITDISISRSFVYLLCNDLKKPLCRISVKQSFLRALKRALPPSPAQSPMVTSRTPHTGKTLSVPTISRQVDVVNDDSNKIKTEAEGKESSTLDNKTGKVEDDSVSNLPATADENLTMATKGDNNEPSLTSIDHAHLPATPPLTSSFCEYMDDDTESTDQASAGRDEQSINLPTPSEEATHPQIDSEAEPLQLELPRIETEALHTNVVASEEPLSLSVVIDSPTPHEIADTPNVPIMEDAKTEQLTGKRSSCDINLQTKEISDSSTNVQSDNISDSSSTKQTVSDSGASVESQQREPTIQEALQTVKAEMKELFKPIKFDKLSNIFKINNPGSTSPSRIRMFVNRNKKTEETGQKPNAEPQDQDIEKEEDTRTTTELPVPKEDSISDQEQSKKPDLKDILKLSRISNLLSKDSGSSSGSVASPAVTTPIIITPAPLDSKEVERRLKMSQSTAENHDDVVVVKKDKKRRKKRKHKKFSSATSKLMPTADVLCEDSSTSNSFELSPGSRQKVVQNIDWYAITSF